MDPASLQFILDNGLAFAYESGLWRVYQPGGIEGTGLTLAEALASLMAALVTVRDSRFAVLDQYSTLDGADAAVVTAVTTGEPLVVKALPVEVVDAGAVEEVV